MTTQRADFYTYIHKSLRRQISEVLCAAGSADFTNASDAMSFMSSLDRLLINLRAHAHHEESYLHPVLERYLPEATQRFHAAHGKQEAWLDSIESGFRATQERLSAELGATSSRELGRFAGYYFVHLAEEEDLTAELNAQAPAEELAAAMAAFQASRGPDEATQDLEAMLPSLNRQDRIALLRPLKDEATPAFIFVMDIAREVLDERTLATLESDLGVGSTG